MNTAQVDVPAPHGGLGPLDDETLGSRASGSIVAFDGAGTPADGPIDVVDLFCGCGGLSVGFEHVGRLVPSFRLAGAADIDAAAIATYQSNLPIQPRETDLLEVASSPARIDEFIAGLALRPGARLVVVGGPPCQGFSAHGKKLRRGDDDRNRLVDAFARIVLRLDPDFVVMENVPELLSRKHWPRFEALRASLAPNLQVRAQVHNLAGFGVPQARFRALVVASPSPFRMPEPYLDGSQYRTVRDAGTPYDDDPMHVCTRHRSSTVDTIKRIPLDGGSRPAGVGPACLDRVDGYRDVYGRLYWDRPANTITGFSRNPASGRYVHPEQHRGLSIREAALLQSFPASWHFEGSFDHRFIQIGNAVPPAFAAFLAAHVFQELEADARHLHDREMAVDMEAPCSNSFSSGIAGRKRGVRNKWA